MTVPPSGSQAETERREGRVSEQVERVQNALRTCLSPRLCADALDALDALARSHEVLRGRADRLEQALREIAEHTIPHNWDAGRDGTPYEFVRNRARTALSAAGQEPDG